MFSNLTQLESDVNGKQDIITGAVTTIVSSNLTKNRALISNSSGKVTISAITSTELGYLGGVTSNIQTQINNLCLNLVDQTPGKSIFLQGYSNIGINVSANNSLRITVPLPFKCNNLNYNVSINSAVIDGVGEKTQYTVYSKSYSSFVLEIPVNSQYKSIYWIDLYGVDITFA